MDFAGGFLARDDGLLRRPPAQLLDRNPFIGLPQKANDLLFRIPLLHGQPPFPEVRL